MRGIGGLVLQILEPKIVAVPDSNGHLTLEEEGYEVTLGNVPGGVIAFKADALDNQGLVRQEASGAVRYGARADYVLLDFYYRRITVVELKSRKFIHKDVVQQLKGARAVTSYLAGLAESFHGEDFGFGDFDWRYVVFVQQGGRKETSRRNKTLDTALYRHRKSGEIVPYPRLSP